MKTITLTNPSAPASIKQQITLGKLTRCDWRNKTCSLTAGEASQLITLCFNALGDGDCATIEEGKLLPYVKDTEVLGWVTERNSMVFRSKEARERYEGKKTTKVVPVPTITVKPPCKPTLVIPAMPMPAPVVEEAPSKSVPMPRVENPMDEVLGFLDKRALVTLITKKLKDLERDELKTIASLILTK
jgi:hypothetical protein